MKNITQKLINLALAEDIGKGDITSNAIVDKKARASAKIIAKQRLVLAGIDTAKLVFKTLGGVSFNALHRDGDLCEKGEVIVTLKGSAQSLLTGERTALNFLQHLSGIATLTRQFVDKVSGTKAKILDTRKTTPGLRIIEKQAVKSGGGANHRIGLFDHFLIKNNHIAIAGSIKKAIALAKRKRKKGQWIEVETRNLKEVAEALECGADIIMLDNMPIEEIRSAVKFVNGKAKIEVSGNITLETIAAYAATGADFISIGKLTHSAPAADIHMLIDAPRGKLRGIWGI